ncbi:MAG: type II 3-dehydroquinate dehydratase [Gammaproteobacteria bacterium]|jgi:3-dehydroquinate dehydratase-2|nr:type II 3-dehydroquinate dehydratase [Gammaproteobacteria bacterium]MCH2576829.1 type II 3-dehydroquinate dehydratase [Pseudomonadales bacterium]MEE3299775.1 type II 3-dehydroquinate dehydratase [Pseudomonadota bacterium]MBI90355.1 type II 3-dehydroquinate dehydratase [Gammaproteobacteria bacterium]HAI15159.1 type II 3-dehydroquinate dehydratase [Gammaproteobacteria bacterium]|tara:strand:+ start:1014 stop:1454 length:441 start_codon:yes stop_codon:yes gene_type:complete
MAKILALHGPNLNLLGHREPNIYGSDTLNDINTRCETICTEAGHEFSSLQSNTEADLINRLHEARVDGTDFMLVNFGGFTHTSIAIRDAILAAEIPFIEVHLSNLYAREEYRHHSYFADIAVGSIVGLGAQGYELAVHAAIKKLEN